jgi:uncharacterized protein (TIGR00369 family)
MPSPLRELNRIIRENRVDQFNTPNRALGMRPVAFTSGQSSWIWENQPDRTLNPFGTIQGGYLALFIDQILSTAIGSVLAEDEWAVTGELKVSFMRALTPQRIEGHGRVVRRTRTAAFLEAQLCNSAGDQAVTASSTWLILRSEPD